MNGRIVHIVAGLGADNGVAAVARALAREQTALGWDARVSTRAADADGGGNGKRETSHTAIANGEDNACHTPDLVFIHGAWRPVLWRAARRAKRRGAVLVRVPAGSFSPVYLRFGRLKKALAGLIERRLLRAADAVIASDAREAAWTRAYEPRVRRILLMPNGVDLPPWEGRASSRPPTHPLREGRASSRPPIRPPWEGRALSRPPIRPPWEGRASSRPPPSPARPPRLLYLGRRHPLKGVDLLTEACAGTGVDLRVEHAAFGAAKEAAFAWCDALALPSRSENFGLVVAEALARGKPVITTDGTPWQGVETHRCGWFVRGFGDARPLAPDTHNDTPPHAPGARFDRAAAVANLRAAVADFARTTPDDLRRMGARGRDWMRSDFAWPRLVADLMASLSIH